MLLGLVLRFRVGWGVCYLPAGVVVVPLFALGFDVGCIGFWFRVFY